MPLYHVLNRGVDGRPLFQDESDYLRFVHDLYEFNDRAPAPQFSRRAPNTNVGHTMSNIRERIVDLHGWCLMRNHYHLIVSERVENGLSLFVRKLNVGYARGFNEKHKRRGTLFQGRTRKVPVERHAHLLYLLHYVHLNPLDYLKGAEHWRERDKGAITRAGNILEYLDAYRWSSFRDYCGQKNFPSILTKKFFADVHEDYRAAIREYLADRENPLLQGLELE